MFRQPFKGDYPISLDFDEVYPPFYTEHNRHKGIDYLCPEGTPILASDDGTVMKVGYEANGYGNYIILIHNNGNGTVYAHLQHILVSRMQIVTKGEQIGMSGNTGYTSGPHLHFEVRRDATKLASVIDPKTVMQNVIDFADGKPQFAEVKCGLCVVVCEEANVRCHCDMSRVITTKKKGETITVSDEVTIYNELPYRDYYDPTYKCWLRIAEHDPFTQMIVNIDKSPGE